MTLSPSLSALQAEVAEVNRLQQALQMQLLAATATPPLPLAHWLVRLRRAVFPPYTWRERLWLAGMLFAEVALEAGVRVAVRRSVKTLRQGSMLRPPRTSVPSGDPQAYDVPALSLPPLQPHRASVDIVVCVHNAPEDVRRCLASVIRYTRPPYRLILVDDGSEAETRDDLAQLAREQGAALIRNETARGYTLAANQGLRQSTGDYVVLLNSDTAVTPDWLDRMIACAESEPRIGLVGPLSNAASWQSIPEIFDAQGDWAENPLPDTITAAEMAQSVAEYAGRVYPRLPFLNGFCLMIKRQVIADVGCFDEATFGKGYGEENDYGLRAREAGWYLAVADDTYIYHRQSRSYSHERRLQLSERAGRALAAKHGYRTVSEGVQTCRHDWVLEGIRARSRVMPARQRLLAEGRARWEGRRVLFILPIDEPSGGANVIFQEARTMRRMGVDVQIVNLAANRAVFEPRYQEKQLPVIYADRPQHIREMLGRYDAVVATLYVSVEWLEPLTGESRLPVRGYYIQDFEPNFFTPGAEDYERAWRSYTRYPGLVRITKTEWNREMVKREIGVDCAVVGPSVDIDLYRPRWREGERPNSPLKVAAMVRPITPRRQPRFTMEVLRELQRVRGAEVEFILFGCGSDDPGFLELPRDFAWRNAGVLKASQLAVLLTEVDIFVDFSSFQAMGLTAMEAMACGAAVIMPQTGGVGSFARPDENCLLVDTTSRDACCAALERLILDERLRQQLQRQALRDIVQHFPEAAAYNTLAALFPEKVA